MTVVLVRDKVSKGDLKKAGEEYSGYIKVDIDIKTGLMTIGGEWHADGEKMLLKNGSKQDDIWGGGINLKTQVIDYNSLINTKPKQDNPSQEILSVKIRNFFEEILKSKFNL